MIDDKTTDDETDKEEEDNNKICWRNVDESLRKRFDRAARFAGSGALGNLDGTKRLKLYGLFKQAKFGPNTDERPWAADLRGCAKWDAWQAERGSTSSEAAEAYVAFVGSLAPGWEKENLEDVEAIKRRGGGGGGGGGMGISVSTMRVPDDDSDLGPSKEDDVFVRCSRGQISEVLKDLDSGAADVNARDDQGMTLLHWACDRDHRELATVLLDRGADVDAVDGDGMTPFHLAVLCENDDLALLLIRRGANPEIKNSDGELPSESYSDALRERLEKRKHD